MVIKTIDSLFHTYDSPKAPGACIMIIKNWEILFKKAYGMAHIWKKIPTSTKTNFRLASLTKQFTATCIVKLIEQWRLKYNDKIVKFFPQLPDITKSITIHHLLTHTSWLPDDYELIPKNRKLQMHDKDYIPLLQKIKKLHFDPGKKFSYINTWYCLLSLIIEKVSWMAFDTFLKKYIFNPLHMNTTSLYTHWWKNIHTRAYGYVQTGHSFSLKDQDISSATSWDGWIYSSLDDLYTRDQALCTDTILKWSSLKKIFSPAILHNWKRIPYGLGREIYYHHGSKILYHGGESCGFKNFIYRIPSKKISIVFLSNRNTWWWISFARKIAKFSWVVS